MKEEIPKPTKRIGIVTHSTLNFRQVLEDKFLAARRQKIYKLADTVVQIGETYYFYVHSVRQLRGLRNYELEFHGLWFNMDGITEIEDEYKMSRMK
jgi:hypothetical protein